MSKKTLTEIASYIPPADAAAGGAVSSSRRRKPARMRGKMRNWAVAAGLACLGSFVACDASAADLGVFGGGGGGGSGSYNGGGGGGAGAVLVNGVTSNGKSYDSLQYHGQGGAASPIADTGSDPMALPSSPGGGTLSLPPQPDGITVNVGNGGSGGIPVGGSPDGEAGYKTQFITNKAFSAEVDSLLVYGGGGGGGANHAQGSAGGGAGYFDGGDSGRTTMSATGIAGGTGYGKGGEWNDFSAPLGFGASGGNGGDAEFRTDGTVTVKKGVEVYSGENGWLSTGSIWDPNGGTGGSVDFTVGTLKTAGRDGKNFSFVLRGGNIVATIGALDLSTSNVDLVLDQEAQQGGLAPAGAVGTMNLGSLVFGAGKTLDITSPSSQWTTFTAGGDITVRGPGAVFNNRLPLAYTAGAMSFTLDRTVRNNTIMLTATGSPIAISGASASLAFAGALSGLRDGNQITLVQNVQNNAYVNQRFNHDDGFFAFQFDTDIQTVGARDDLIARLRRSLSPGSKAPGGSSLTVVNAVNSGFDRIQNVLADNYFQPGICGSRFCNNQGRPFVFASMGFDAVKLRTGSHSDTNQASALVGVGALANAGAGDLFYGAFIEGGYGDYDYHGKTSSGQLRADGDAKHLGAGVLARYTICNGMLFEGSLRLGRAWNDFALRNDNNYKTAATYWGGHLGVSKFFQLSHMSNLELYGKFYYTRLGSDSRTVRSGYRVDVDATDSARSSLGFRYNHKLGGGFALVAGAAWEYEFSGKSKTLIDRVRTPDSSIRGSTGLAELGMKWKSDCTRWDVALKARGMVGKRLGVGGQFSVGYGF